MRMFLALLLSCSSVVAQPSYWFSGLQRQPNAYMAQQYWFHAGYGISITFTNPYVFISLNTNALPSPPAVGPWLTDGVNVFYTNTPPAEVWIGDGALTNIHLWTDGSASFSNHVEFAGKINADKGVFNEVEVSTNLIVHGILYGNGFGLTNIQSSNVVGVVNGTNGLPGVNGTNGLPGLNGTNAAVGLVTNIWTTNVSGTVPGSSINSAVSNATAAVTAVTVTSASLTNTIPIANVTTPGAIHTNGMSIPATFSNQAYGPFGSAVAPTYSFSSATNCGWYSSSAGNVAFTSGGTRYWGFGVGSFSGRSAGSYINLDSAGYYGLCAGTDGGSSAVDVFLRRDSIGTIRVDTNLVARGVITATNGFVSKSRSLLAPVVISVGASPFNFTNSVAGGTGGTNNIYVFVDGAGVTGTVGINGTTVFSTLVGADVTVPLQPQEYCTITYTIGTPAMKWKPF